MTDASGGFEVCREIVWPNCREAVDTGILDYSKVRRNSEGRGEMVTYNEEPRWREPPNGL